MANPSHGPKMNQEKRNDMGPSEGYITTDDGIRLFFQKLGTARKQSFFLARLGVQAVEM